MCIILVPLLTVLVGHLDLSTYNTSVPTPPPGLAEATDTSII